MSWSSPSAAETFYPLDFFCCDLNLHLGKPEILLILWNPILFYTPTPFFQVIHKIPWTWHDDRYLTYFSEALEKLPKEPRGTFYRGIDSGGLQVFYWSNKWHKGPFISIMETWIFVADVVLFITLFFISSLNNIINI